MIPNSACTPSKQQWKWIHLYFFLSCSDIHLFIVSVEGYCLTWSHSVTHTHTYTLGGTPLEDGSASRRGLYLTHNRQTPVSQCWTLFCLSEILTGNFCAQMLVIPKRVTCWGVKSHRLWNFEFPVWFPSFSPLSPPHGTTTPSGTGPPRRGFTFTLCRTPLDEWSAGRRDLCLTTHKRHNIHATGGIRTRYPSKLAAAYPHLRSKQILFTLTLATFRHIQSSSS